MRTENVMYFTEKEEEFANLLIEIGTKRNVAKVLVFLANTSEATSRAIERGTDLRQPEVSIAMRYLIEQDWISSRESKAESKGRPVDLPSWPNPSMRSWTTSRKRRRRKRTTSSHWSRSYGTTSAEVIILHFFSLPTITVVLSTKPVKSPLSTTPGTDAIAASTRRAVRSQQTSSRR